jgi:nucleotide-binding universal stress UspA family protein
MFKRILLPLDLSDHHAAAINAAVTLARQRKGKVTLLHVIEQIPGIAVAEEEVFYRRLERAARAHLEHSAPA